MATRWFFSAQLKELPQDPTSTPPRIDETDMCDLVATRVRYSAQTVQRILSFSVHKCRTKIANSESFELRFPNNFVGGIDIQHVRSRSLELIPTIQKL